MSLIDCEKCGCKKTAIEISSTSKTVNCDYEKKIKVYKCNSCLDTFKTTESIVISSSKFKPTTITKSVITHL
jgi:hypothetical protein